MTRLFVEQLTVIDCAYLDAVRGLVGESWIVDLELAGALDPQSMVLDFGDFKKLAKRALDASVDHTLLVPLRAPGLVLRPDGATVSLEFSGPAAGPISFQAPRSAVTLLDAAHVDPASLSTHLVPQVTAALPEGVSVAALVLRNEAIEGAYYHYTHGLKKHAGQCQRIAHGHRSRLEIRVDGVRDAALEAHWAARWADIYLGTREDLADAGDGRVAFAYTASEGRFALALPASRCQLIDADTTVERLAEHLAAGAAAQRPGCAIEVRAYEGVMKGAIARV
jgi:6-pyruvoyl-tetrahydropterin synthase